MILKLISYLIIWIGVIFIYDARILMKRWFGYGDQNLETTGLKMLGVIFTIIGAILLFILN